MQHLAFTLARQSDQVLQERLGIGFSQFKILMVLNWKTNVQQRTIADSLGQTEASISRQIKLLDEQGLLSTHISPENRRQHLTVLTPTGKRVIDEALQILQSYHEPVFETLSEKQKSALQEMLVNMHRVACSSKRPGACDHPINL